MMSVDEATREDLCDFKQSEALVHRSAADRAFANDAATLSRPLDMTWNIEIRSVAGSSIPSSVTASEVGLSMRPDCAGQADAAAAPSGGTGEEMDNGR